MSIPLTTDLRLGEGFAFFRWHTIQYDGDAWVGFAHPAYEQTECRRLFRMMNPLSALDRSQK